MPDFLKNPIIKRLLASGIRRGLDALGALLIARGLATEAEWTTLAASAAPLLASFLWSLYEKAQADKRIDVALQMPAGRSREDLAKAMKVID